MPGPFYKANVFPLLLPRLLWVCFKVTWGDLGLLFKPPSSSDTIVSAQANDLKDFFFFFFLTNMGDFAGLAYNITLEHLVNSCQFWEV